MVSFLAGKPNADTFPFSAIRVDLKPVVRQNLRPLGAFGPQTDERITQVPGDPVETLTIEADALSEGLQYGATAGLPSLNKWLENLQQMRHKRAKDGSWRLSLGSGSQDLINKVRLVGLIMVECESLLTVFFLIPIQAFCSLVNEDDSILMESPVYSCAHSPSKSLDPNA